MQSLFILGRQPALGLAELESLYGPARLRPIGSQAAVLDVDPQMIDFNRLGGTVKLCKVLTMLDTTDWNEIEQYLVRNCPHQADELSEGKLQLGLSVYDLAPSVQRLMATGLSIKKAIKKTGRSVRLIPNTTLELNTAQVEHNHLLGATGWELVIVRSGNQTIITQTIRLQDIASYTIRDRGRPKRDARVGMLPPKLAQIITNLAAATTQPSKETIVLDPFCGTGVLLQEAALMGYGISGTDLEPRMIEYSLTNLSWLAATYQIDTSMHSLVQADATTHQWSPLPQMVAGETYLGRPFTTPPSPEILNQTMSEVNLIIKKFLRNIGSQISVGTRLCLAVPAWQTRAGQFKHLPLLDGLPDMGYNVVSFEHVSRQQLVYCREGQIVARELLTLIKA